MKSLFQFAKSYIALILFEDVDTTFNLEEANKSS